MLLETRILLVNHLQMIGRWGVCLRPLASRPGLLCFRVVHKSVGSHASEVVFVFYLIIVKKSQPQQSLRKYNVVWLKSLSRPVGRCN